MNSVINKTNLLETLLANAAQGDLVALRELDAYLTKHKAHPPTIVQLAKALNLFAINGDDSALCTLFGLCGELSLNRADPVVRQQVYQTISTPLKDNDNKEFSPYLYEIACGYHRGWDGYPQNKLIAAELFNLFAQRQDDIALRTLFKSCGNLADDPHPKLRREIHGIITNPPPPTGARLMKIINSGVKGIIVFRPAAHMP